MIPQEHNLRICTVHFLGCVLVRKGGKKNHSSGIGVNLQTVKCSWDDARARGEFYLAGVK